jgi:hypothetical protein
MSINIPIFGNDRMLAPKLFRGLLCISISLLWEADDTLVDVGFPLFNKLENVALNVLLIVKRADLLIELIV